MSGEITVGGNILASHTGVEGAGSLTLGNTVAPASSYMFRNKIINGDMRISQRHGSTGVIGSTNNSVDYPVDRFFYKNSFCSVFNYTQSTDAPENFKYSSYPECTTAAPTLCDGLEYLQFEQRIEASNLVHLKYGTSSAKRVTVSFWIKTNKAGTYVIRLYRGSPGRAIHHPIVINQSDTWEKHTHTFPGDTVEALASDSSEGFRFTIWLAAGSYFNSASSLGPVDNWGSYASSKSAVGNVNLADTVGNYFAITGVQLEEGPVATPFEHRPLSVELAMCQRYLQKSYNLDIPIGSPTGTGNSGYVEWNWGSMVSWGTVQIPFRQSMRVSPTFSIYNIGSGILNGFAYWDGSQTVQTTYSLGSFYTGENWAIWFLDSTSMSLAQFHWSANAEL